MTVHWQLAIALGTVPENRNFNALLSVCRTNRWILLLTAPLKKHTDNQTRDMVDITGVVYKSYHRGGFNFLKVTSGEISQSGKEYNHRMSFSKKKVDFWVSFNRIPKWQKNMINPVMRLRSV